MSSYTLSDSQPIIFELCAESLEACLLAKSGGADRIELCADLQVEGLTPSYALVREAVRRSGLPVYMLLRPRAGDFVYDELEFALMREDLLHGRELGVSGFAMGVLHADGRVNVEQTRELVALASPLEITFHRAFDATPSLPQALEDVIRAGCQRVLTSGGTTDVYDGAAMLTQLVRQARGRIEIAAGGGLRVKGAADLVVQTGARHYHGSVRSYEGDAYGRTSRVDEEDVARLVRSLRSN